MLKSRWLPYIGAGPILVAVLLTAAVVSAVWPAIHGHEPYPDPVASVAAWGDVYKAKDMRVVELWVVLVAGLTVSISLLARRISSAQPDLEFAKPLNELLLVSLIPAAWRLAIACSIPVEHMPPLRFLASFPFVAVLAIIGLTRYRKQLRPDQVLVIGGAILVATLLSLFAGLAFPTAISRLFPHSVDWFRRNDKTSMFPVAMVGLLAFAIITQWIASNTADVFEHRMLRTLKCMQLPLPLLFFYMVPSPLIDPLHRFRTPYPTALVVTLSVCCVTAWGFMWWRFRKPVGDASTGYPLVRALAPVSVAAIVLFVYCGSAGLPVTYPDYFHWGEQVLPWQQWYDFGKRPYVDYVPIHGLMPFSRGFFDQVFFDGTLASFSGSDVLLTGIAAVSVGLAASMLVTPLGALVLLLGALPSLDRMYFLAPAMFLVASPSLLKKPLRLLCIWIAVSLLMVAYNPTIGPAFVVGTIPLALWLVYRLCFENIIGLVIVVLVIAGCAIAGWENKPIHLMGVQFTHFMVDNAWTNEVAHGIQWDRGENQRDAQAGVGSTQFLWEIGRVGWAVVALIAAGLFWQEFRRPIGTRRSSLLVLAGCAPLVMLLTIPWIWGRIDPGVFGRSGSLAHFAIYLLLPALVLLYIPREQLVRGILIVAMVVGYFYQSNPASSDVSILTQVAVQARRIPAEAVMADGKDLGLPRLGQVIQPEPNYLLDILRLKKILPEFLKPGETYVDLTNKSALYYYLDMPCPVRYPSFVAANSRLAGGELEQLKEHPVPAVMVGPVGELDDVPASLRTYELYHDYVLKFRPIQRAEYTFLVDPARLNRPPGDYTEQELGMLDPIFVKDNLLRLPVAWGESWDSLKGRFDHVANVDISTLTYKHDLDVKPDGKMIGTGPICYWEYRIPPEVKAGATADFIRISFDEQVNNPAATRAAIRYDPIPGPTSAETSMACYWVGSDAKYSRPFMFKSRSGDLLLPMGSYHRWLLDKGLTTLRLDVLNPQTVKWFKISQIEFLHLRPL